MKTPQRGAVWQAMDPTDPAFRIAQSPFYRIAQVIGRYYQEMDRVLKPIGMDVPHWRVLTMLEETPSATVSDLARATVMQISTMTKLAHRMAEEGLIRLHRAAGDARVTEAVLTARGKDMVGQVRVQGARIFAQAFADIPDDQIATFNQMLGQVFANLAPPGGAALRSV